MYETIVTMKINKCMNIIPELKGEVGKPFMTKYIGKKGYLSLSALMIKGNGSLLVHMDVLMQELMDVILEIMA